MTKAHVRPSSRQKTPQTEHVGSEEVVDGEGNVEYYTLGEHKFPISIPSLPPLQIGKALASKSILDKQVWQGLWTHIIRAQHHMY